MSTFWAHAMIPLFWSGILAFVLWIVRAPVLKRKFPDLEKMLFNPIAPLNPIGTLKGWCRKAPEDRPRASTDAQ